MELKFKKGFVALAVVGAVVIIAALYLGYEDFALQIVDRIFQGAE